MAFDSHVDRSTIAAHVHSCLAAFQHIQHEIVIAKSRIRCKLSPGVINDELGRLRLWSGNVGAHRSGGASLDYKLREASHIRGRVIELLQSLGLVLQDLTTLVTGERTPWEDLSDSDSESDSSDGGEYSEQSPTTEAEQLACNIAEINTCLMRLSMAIRNPAPHDQFIHSAHIKADHFEPFDIDHVRGKFPHAQEYLVLRLGKAIFRRRQYLNYREIHRKKLGHGLEPQSQSTEHNDSYTIPPTEQAPSEHVESTLASSLPEAIKATSSVSELDENDYYEDTLSQTSYTSSTYDSAKLCPPPLPQHGRDGAPFECPLCYRLTSVRQADA
jgi:hypothetical protein